MATALLLPKLRTIVVTALAVGALLCTACGHTKPGKVTPADGTAGAGATDGGASGSGGGGEVGADAHEVGDDTGDREAPEASETGGIDAAPADGSPDRSDLGDGATEGDADALSCGEPTSCPPADDTKTPVISCLSPSVVQVHQAFRLNIYGQYLHLGTSGSYSIVTLSGAVLNGALVTPCHITVDVDATVLGTARDIQVVVSPGGRSGQSQAVILTVR
jgi:hypothetical protein